jgi:hypothetical protein
MKTSIHFLSYLSQFLEWEMVQTKVVEEVKTQILFIFILFIFFIFFLNSCSLWDNVQKYCRAGQATDDSKAHVILHDWYLRLQIHTQNM